MDVIAHGMLQKATVATVSKLCSAVLHKVAQSCAQPSRNDLCMMNCCQQVSCSQRRVQK